LGVNLTLLLFRDLLIHMSECLYQYIPSKDSLSGES
jgi:hypothetical protein